MAATVLLGHPSQRGVIVHMRGIRNLEGPGLQPSDGAENCGIRSDKRGRTSGTS